MKMSIIWYNLACGRHMRGLVPMRLFQQNFRSNNMNVKSAFSTQQTVDNGQLQFVNVDLFQNRQLYTRNTLGLDKLQLHHSNVEQFYKDNKYEYLERLTKYIDQQRFENLVQDDLINLIGLADNVEHLDLIEKLIRVFATNQKFFSSGWGTAIMRLYYTMDQTDRANKNLRNERAFGQIFNKKSCYRIAMTMLYNAGRYHDVIDLYHLACQRLEPAGSGKGPQHPGISVLAFAAYAKLNTPKSLTEALKLQKEVDFSLYSGYLKMRVISFLVHMHIGQGQPMVALNLIEKAPFTNHVTMRELKTIALIDLNLYDDVICHILQTLQLLERGNKLMLRDVYDKLHSNLHSINDRQVRRRLEDTLLELKQNKLVAERTLESLLFTGINNHKISNQPDLDVDVVETAIQLAKRQRRIKLKALKGDIS